MNYEEILFYYDESQLKIAIDSIIKKGNYHVKSNDKGNGKYTISIKKKILNTLNWN